MTQELSDILGAIVKIFAFAIGVFIGASIAKWVFAVLAYLASQILMFIAAAGFIIVVVEVLQWLGNDITADDARLFFAKSREQVVLFLAQIIFWMNQFGDSGRDSGRFPADVVFG